MKAQVFRGVNQLCYEDIPVPTLKPDEVLVQVQVVGLCQSDIKKIRYPLYEPPRIFGHETAGTISAVGSEVTGWQIGQRVAVMHHIPCMRCDYCLMIISRCAIPTKIFAQQQDLHQAAAVLRNMSRFPVILCKMGG